MKGYVIVEFLAVRSIIVKKQQRGVWSSSSITDTTTPTRGIIIEASRFLLQS